MEDCLEGCTWNLAWNMATRMLKVIWHPAEETGSVFLFTCTGFVGLNFVGWPFTAVFFNVISYFPANHKRLNFFKGHTKMLNSISDFPNCQPNSISAKCQPALWENWGGIYENSSDCLFFPFTICWTEKEPTRGNWLPENWWKNRKPKVKDGENNVCF